MWLWCGANSAPRLASGTTSAAAPRPEDDVALLSHANVCEVLASSLGALYLCEPRGDHVRLRTPYLYPDGDGIDLFVRVGQGGRGVVTDLGETVRWLRMQAVGQRRTTKQREILRDVTLTHGVEFHNGILSVRFDDTAGITAAVTRIGEACIRVADLWYLFRTRAVESLSDEVADYLTENRILYDRGEVLIGRSQSSWQVDFRAGGARSSLVFVLSTGSRSVAKTRAEHVLAAWVDLQHMKVGPGAVQFLSLVDDTLDVWTPETLRLVQSDGLSRLILWSEPHSLLDALGVA